MKKAIAMIQACLLSAALSACSVFAPLDMRCDDVGKRIEMHAGSRWHLGRAGEYSALAENDEPREEVLSSESADKKKTYCEAHPSRRAPNIPNGRATHTDSVTPTSRLERHYAQDSVGVCMLGGKEPGPGVPRTSVLAAKKYLEEREVALYDEKFMSESDGSVFPVQLINHGMNCQPLGKRRNKRWKCNSQLSVEPDGLTGALKECFDTRPSTRSRAINFFGLVKDRYCLYISVIEQKNRSGNKKSWPTNINIDLLKVELYCVSGDEGSAPPGVIVGGPRPNFRAPITQDGAN